MGENDARVRERCCAELEHLGIELDPARNASPTGEPAAVHADGSRVAILVVATNEELQIAHEAQRCLSGSA